MPQYPNRIRRTCIALPTSASITCFVPFSLSHLTNTHTSNSGPSQKSYPDEASLSFNSIQCLPSSD